MFDVHSFLLGSAFGVNVRIEMNVINSPPLTSNSMDCSTEKNGSDDTVNNEQEEMIQVKLRELFNGVIVKRFEGESNYISRFWPLKYKDRTFYFFVCYFR